MSELHSRTSRGGMSQFVHKCSSLPTSEKATTILPKHQFLKQNSMSALEHYPRKSRPAQVDKNVHQFLEKATTIQPKNQFLKQNSMSALEHHLEQSQALHVDKNNKRHSFPTMSCVTIGQIRESRSSSSPKVRVSSGSLFYNEVLKQQKIHDVRQSANNATPFENISPEIKTPSFLSGTRQFGNYSEMSVRQVIFLAFWCNLCFSLHLYYLISTSRCQVCVRE